MSDLLDFDIEQEAIEKQLKGLLDKVEVRQAMAIRCDEDGHSYENGISLGLPGSSAMLRVVQTCRWCTERR